MGSALVVGAGPAGATLASALANRGIDVTLVERHDDLQREFRGEWLSASGRAALRLLDVGDLLTDLPQLHSGSGGGVSVWIRGRERLRVQAPQPNPDEDFLLVPQPALLQAIIDRAAQLPTFRMERPVLVRDLLREDERVVGIRGTRHGESVELRADIVIACDGRASVLRRRSGVPVAQERDERFDMLWFKAPVPPSMDADCAYQFVQRDGTAFCHPHPDGPHQYGWAFSKGSYGDIRAGGPHAWADAIAGHVPPVFAEYLQSIREDIEVAFLNIVCFHLDRWSEPGLLLIGDAAHPMSAVGGQGINMALRDVVVTVNHLSPLLRAYTVDAAALDAAAAQVATERLPEIRRIQAMQQSASKMLHLETPAARFLIERVAPVLGRFAGPLMTRGVGGTKPFRHGVTDVALTA